MIDQEALVNTIEPEMMPLNEEQAGQKGNHSTPKAKKSKKGILMGMLGVGALALIGGGYWFGASSTSMAAVSDRFVTAVNAEDYQAVAELLTVGKDRWTAKEAEQFVKYLDRHDVNLNQELQQIAATNGKEVYTDHKGNKLLGFVKDGTTYGIFPDYHVKAYPLDVTVSTNMATVSLDGKALKKGEAVNLGEFKFIPEVFALEGETELGTVSQQITLDLEQASQNNIDLSLEAKDKTVTITLPEQASQATDIEMIVNGKSFKGKSQTLQLIDNQTLEVAANFKVDGMTFKTSSEKLTNTQDRDALSVDVSLTKDDQAKLTDLVKANEKKNVEAKQAETLKADVTSFLGDWREDLYDSIRVRSDYFSSYYDTTTSAYQSMKAFVTGSGESSVADSKIDYYESLAFEVLDVTSQENGTIVAKAKGSFISHYTDSKSPREFNRQYTITLRRDGESFAITDYVQQ